MIHVRIQVYEVLGLWKLHELEVSDGLGTSQHVLHAREVYASEGEAVTMAKYEARRRIAEIWSFVTEDQINWHIKTAKTNYP